MKKFQEWQDNQTYFGHLSNLNIIRSRKTLQTSNYKRRPVKQNRSLSQEEIMRANQRMVRRIENPKRITINTGVDYFRPTFSKEKYQVYERNLNHKNFLFGKRILEVQPVISTTKLTKQYETRKPDRSSNTSANNSCHTRTHKLLQYLNSEQTSLRPKGFGRHVLELRILQYEFNKLKIRDDDIHHVSIVAQFGRVIKRSDPVPVRQFTQKRFQFKFSKKSTFDGKVRAHIRYHNGILDTELGYFDFSIKYFLDGETRPEVLDEQTMIFKKVGAYGGQILFNAQVLGVDDRP